jgi:autotransporter translocation and assembly factor TamB
MTVVPNGVTYTNIAGKVELQPDRVHIDQLTVLDNHQSALSLTGDLAVHAREVGGVQLWVVAEDFKILDNAAGNVRVNSAIEVAGELKSPVLQGDFGISTGRINLDELMALAGPSAYSTTPAEFVNEPRATDSVANAAAPEKEASVFDALRMNLRLQIPDDLVVRAENLQAPGATVGLGALNVTLGGDLTATKDPGGPVRLVGEVNTVRGTYDFQGRRFEILRDGTVRFDGGEQLQPVLDIRTRREIQGVEARVTIRGRIDQPEIILASTPPLEEADILSLIVFNQPINQLGEGQAATLSARAQSLAVGAVAGQLAAQIGSALNLDTFEINVGPENGAAAEVTLGQQVGKDLYVKVQQGVGDMTSTNVVVEYAIAQWLRLQTNILQGASGQQSLFRRQQGSGVDLIVLFTR